MMMKTMTMMMIAGHCLQNVLAEESLCRIVFRSVVSEVYITDPANRGGDLTVVHCTVSLAFPKLFCLVTRWSTSEKEQVYPYLCKCSAAQPWITLMTFWLSVRKSKCFFETRREYIVTVNLQ